MRAVNFNNNECVTINKNLDGSGTVIISEEPIEKYVKLHDLNSGERFIAGNKKFTVLEQFEDGVAVVETVKLEKQKFDNNSNDWRSSDLRNYLNTDVLRIYENLFGSENIIETETDLTSLDGLNDYGKCYDKIRLMAFDEYRKYQFLFEREEKWEWLVTPWSTTKRGWDVSVCVVSPRSNILSSFCDDDNAVRPFCILKSNIFVSLEGRDE